MGMFKDAKKNVFSTEVKEVFKAAETEWIQDSMYETKERIYARVKPENVQEGSQYEELDLSGRNDLEYAIKVNKKGEI